MKWNRHFNAMYASSAQQICNGVVESFRSFKQLLRLFGKGDLANKPFPPNYRKLGLFTVSYPQKWLKLIDNKIKVSLGKKVKAWLSLDAFYIPMASNLDWNLIKKIRILPRHGCFYAEFFHELKKPIS
ncbi:MAG: hypothetical protein AB4080_00530 [Trichodesmium sp.]